MPVQTRSQTKMLQEQSLNENVTIRLTRKKPVVNKLRELIQPTQAVNYLNETDSFIVELLKTKLKNVEASKINGVYPNRKAYFDCVRLITEIYHILNTHCFDNTDKSFAKLNQSVYNKAKEILDILHNQTVYNKAKEILDILHTGIGVTQPETEEEHQIVRIAKEELHKTIKVLDQYVKKEPFYELHLSNKHKKFVYDDLALDI
jgi:hypothetical protein